jgi:hypothetical protein
MEAIKNPRFDAFVRKGRPFSEIREWITYLTAPEDLRENLIPGSRPGIEARADVKEPKPRVS